MVKWPVVVASINLVALGSLFVAFTAIVANVLVTRSTRSHERRMKVLEWRQEAYLDLLEYLYAWTYVIENEARAGRIDERIPAPLPSLEELTSILAKVTVVGTREVQNALSRYTMLVSEYRSDEGQARDPKARQEMRAELGRLSTRIADMVARDVQGRRGFS
jgi:HAMP domain-containing protein